MNTVLKEAEQKQTAVKQQEQQSAQQMQEQNLAAMKEQKQMEIDAAASKDEKNRQRDILVAEIRAAGYGAATDVNQNQMSDYQDAMKDVRDTEQYQEQTNLQREKEVNRMNIDSQKNEIEREKIAAQKEIANKQLQIAQTNKNKFDKGKNDKKKD